MTNYKALCAELTDELHGYASANPHHDSDELINRARAALAAEPVPPADGEVAELVAWLRCQKGQIPGSYTEFDRRIDRAADLLERLDEPGVVEPTDEELEKLADDYMAMDGATGGMCLGHLDFARAILDRWRRLAPLAEPESVGPTQDEIMSLAYEYFTFRGNSHRDSFFATSIETKKDPCASLDDFVRAVLACWGQ